MDIQIQISNPTESVIRALAAALGGDSETSTPISKPSGQAPDQANATPDVEKPKRQRKAPEEQKTDPEPQRSNEEAAADSAPDSEAQVPTVVEIRAKAQEVGQTPEGKKAVKALLDKFGAESLSKIPEDQRAAFLEKLEQL